MRSATIRSRMLMLLAVTALVGTAARLLAAPPPRLSPQEQDPAVEAIIKTLETKAAALGDGVWTTASGLQDQPGTPASTVLQKAAWYLRDTVDGKPFLLFSQAGAFDDVGSKTQLALDSIYKNRIRSYSQSYLVLHMNYRPRQFLGDLRLKFVTDSPAVTTYVHLRATAFKDPRVAEDPKHPNAGVPLTVDVYYDTTRQAIALVTSADSERVTSQVTAWDKFGTNSLWPSLATCGHGTIDMPSKFSGKPLIISVAKFTPGADPGAPAAAAQQKGVTFYHGNPDDLRMPAAYATAVDANPTELTARVIWTQSLLATGAATDGLAQWKTLETALSNDADRQALAAILGPNLWAGAISGIHEAKQEAASAELVARWADLPKSSQGVAANLFGVWKELRNKPACQTTLALAKDKLITSFVASRDTGLLTNLMLLTKSAPAEAPGIEAALTQAAATPFPADGYSKSNLPLLLKAAYQAHQPARVAPYLGANSSLDPASSNLAKIDLAVDAFDTGYLSDGLEYWKAFDGGAAPAAATQPEQVVTWQKAQAGKIALAAAKGLGQKNAETQVPASLDLLKRLAVTELPEYPWREASLGVVNAWMRLRKSDANRTALASVDSALVGKFATSQNAETVRILIVAAAYKKDTDLIEPVLSQVAGSVLPPHGYTNTAPSALLNAVLQLAADDPAQVRRAEKYLSQINWDPKTPPEAKTAVPVIASLLNAGKAVDKGDTNVGGTLVDLYATASAREFLVADQELRKTSLTFAESLGARAMLARLAKDSAAAPAVYVSASAGKPGAQVYWDKVITRRETAPTAGKSPPQASAQVRLVGELGQSVEQVLKVPDFESKTWVALAQSDLLAPPLFTPMARVDYFNKGFAAAKSDELRLKALKPLTEVLLKADQYDLAAQTVDQLGNAIHDADAAQKVADLKKHIDWAKANYLASATAKAKKMEADRVSGRVTYLKDRIADAKTKGLPAENIAALEQSLEQLQIKAAEPKALSAPLPIPTAPSATPTSP